MLVSSSPVVSKGVAATMDSLVNKQMVRSQSESCLTSETSDESIGSDEDDEALLALSDSTSSSSHLLETNTAKPLRRRRSSIRSYNVEEIPIRNRGWKNLPKVTVPRPSSEKTLADTSLSSSPPYSQEPLRVSFQNVEFRCFEQCAGDNPAVSIGTPVSLDWEYEDKEAMGVDSYEESRGKRRTSRQLMMNYFQRRTLLSYRYGLSEEEINAAEKAANKARNQRALTRTLLPASLFEDLVTSAARKTKRVLSKKDAKEPEGLIVPLEESRQEFPEVLSPSSTPQNSHQPSSSLDVVKSTKVEEDDDPMSEVEA